MNAKNIFTSKTFWFNILAAILEVLQQTGVINQIVPPGGIATGLIAGNIALRTITNQPVKLTS